MLTTAANVALERNITVPEGVEATVCDGDLTLTGTVAYGMQRAGAESAVAGLTGVRHVNGRHRHQLRLPTRLTSTCTSRRRWSAPR